MVYSIRDARVEPERHTWGFAGRIYDDMIFSN